MKVATLVIVIAILAIVIFSNLQMTGKIGKGQISLGVNDDANDSINTGTANETETAVQSGGTGQ